MSDYEDLRLKSEEVERFWTKVVVDCACDCWVWVGARGSGGYGHIRKGGRMRLAHRISYATWKGEVSPGLQVDHLCRVRACVNPAHMEPVAQLENIMRGDSPSARHAAKRACPKCGGTYDCRDGDGSRRCAACTKKKNREWYDKNREYALAKSREWYQAKLARQSALAKAAREGTGT